MQEAIIQTKFHLSSANPKLVGPGKPRKFGLTKYNVADRFANRTIEAIRPRAGRGLRQTDIPLRVRNTLDREDEGTPLCVTYASDRLKAEIVTRLRTVHALQFFDQDMVGEKGYDPAILEALDHADVEMTAMQHQIGTVDVPIFIGCTDFDKVVRAPHLALADKAPHLAGDRRAA